MQQLKKKKLNQSALPKYLSSLSESKTPLKDTKSKWLEGIRLSSTLVQMVRSIKVSLNLWPVSVYFPQHNWNLLELITT